MDILRRLEEHIARREWLHADREAARLMLLEPLTDREMGRTYRMWGRAKAGLNEIHAGIKLLEESLPYALKVLDWDCLGLARADLGALYTSIGDLYSGVNYLRAYLLDLERYQEAAPYQGKVSFNLALAYRYQRQYRESIMQYNEALDWCALRGYTTEKAMAHQNLAWLYCTINQIDDARLHLELADTYRETLSPEFDAEQICGWAFYYWKSRRVGDAINCVQEILLTGRPGVDKHHRGQVAIIGGQIALLLGQKEWAEQLLDLAMDAAIDTTDPVLAEECSNLRSAIDSRWQWFGTDGC